MIGEVVGSYRIERKLGEGGMGVVYLASHTLIGRKAAVKVLLPEYSQRAQVVERFFNEAKATALIKHPGLVDIYDFGHHASGSAFIVMEFLDGESLRQRLDREGRLPSQLAVAIARQIAAAVGAAHAKGIIHRDLKPDNVFLLPDSDIPIGLRAKIVDFGIAKLTGEHASDKATKTTAILGTPRYMSPEQCRGAGYVDHRSDIYSVGCLLFEMVCGRTPFVAEGAGELISAHLVDPVPRPSSIGPVPPGLERVILRMLEKKPDARYPNMAELGADLDAIAQEREPTGARIPLPTVQHPLAHQVTVTTLSGAAGESSQRRIGGSKIAAIVTGAVVLVAGLGVGLMMMRRSEPKVIVETTTPAALEKPVAAAVAPVAAAVAPVAAPSKVKLTIASTPPKAKVFRVADGVLVGLTPYSYEVARTDGMVEYVVKLSGYRDEQVSLPADRDGEKTVELKPVRGAKPTKPESKAKPGDKKLPDIVF